jgi:hypothetical protein
MIRPALRPTCHLLLVLFATFLPPAVADTAAPPQSAEAPEASYRGQKLADYLVGKWFHDEITPDNVSASDETLLADGSFNGVITLVGPGSAGPGAMKLVYAGHWKIEGDVMVQSTATSTPALPDLPVTEKYRIEVVDERNFIQESLRSGKRLSIQRAAALKPVHATRASAPWPDPGPSESWADIEKNATHTLSYDKSSVQRHDGISGAWTRMTLTDEAIKQIAVPASQGNTPTPKSIDSFILFDCTLKAYRQQEVRVTLSNGQNVAVKNPAGTDPQNWNRMNALVMRPGNPLKSLCTHLP